MNFKSLALNFGLGLALCASGWAQAPATKYSFENIKYPHDKFTQLLGINNAGKIAGYHNFLFPSTHSGQRRANGEPLLLPH